jgi:hypothetical protein
MASTYTMPTPEPPSDHDLDLLDAYAGTWLVRVDVDPEVRRTIRNLRDAVRRLRVKVAKVEAERDSEKAVAAIARDERVAGRCPGVGTPPKRRSDSSSPFDEPIGLCSMCNYWHTLDGEVLSDHPPRRDQRPPVRPA